MELESKPIRVTYGEYRVYIRDGKLGPVYDTDDLELGKITRRGQGSLNLGIFGLVNFEDMPDNGVFIAEAWREAFSHVDS